MLKNKTKLSGYFYVNAAGTEHTAVVINSVWGVWNMSTPSISGTTTGITNTEVRFLFNTRCRMLEVRANFEGQYDDKLCPLCAEDQDSKQHLLQCEVLMTAGTVVNQVPVYENIFEGTLEEKVSIARIIKEKYSMRKKLKK